MRRRAPTIRAAFTFVELMIVVVVAAILALAAWPDRDADEASALDAAADALEGDIQYARSLAILDPDSVDPRGYGYHTIQSTITVGKGGLSGIKGETDVSQSVLKFLPEPHSDFIFAVTAENTGFIGCVSLLLAYALLLSRMIAGARQASDRAGMLVIMSIVCGMAFQIFMNVGMALGVLPVIGVPLPLMSAGLSAILSTFVAIGFVVSVKLRRFVN